MWEVLYSKVCGSQGDGAGLEFEDLIHYRGSLKPFVWFPLVHKDSVGRSLSSLLDLSYSSSAALFLRISRGSMFVWISQAAVGEDLIPPEMNLK